MADTTTDDRYTVSDLGLARRFVDQHQDRVLYIPEMGGWHVFDGRRYQRDITGETVRLMKQTVASVGDLGT